MDGKIRVAVKRRGDPARRVDTLSRCRRQPPGQRMSRLGMRIPTVVRTKSLQAMGPKEHQRGASRESPRARRGHTGRSLQGSTGTEAARCPGRTSIPGAPGGPKTGAARLPGRSSIPGGQGGTPKGAKDWGRPLTRQIQQSREGRGGTAKTGAAR